ncbi:16648_t:CDS:2 [Acaulospora morrowiae]|uniref:16648_t:CDS:1 n=1 Tax=Acaulospora morrowiae TaxID=94023 RepID=A0A9N8VCQ1_9GLOM|nr:16648_t:CDS:2 [Acaulospora morrowiae]
MTDKTVIRCYAFNNYIFLLLGLKERVVGMPLDDDPVSNIIISNPDSEGSITKFTDLEGLKEREVGIACDNGPEEVNLKYSMGKDPSKVVF